MKSVGSTAEQHQHQDEAEDEDTDNDSEGTTSSEFDRLQHANALSGTDNNHTIPVPQQVWMNVKYGGNNEDITPLNGLAAHDLQPSSAMIHAGYRCHTSERSLKPPVYRSTAYEFSSAEEAELYYKRAYNLKGNDGVGPGLIYARMNNPNTEIFEDKMVSLERGANFASAFPSGMSAITTAIMALIPRGGHIIHTRPVYGGTSFFLETVCPSRFGITTQCVDTSDKEAMRTAIDNATRVDLLYIESPANPTLALTDIAFAANMAKLMNGECLVFVDNTFMGPVFQSPLLHGADVVLYSATSFLGGHNDLMAGVALTDSEDLIYKINGFRTFLGPVISPDTAWMLVRSLETVWMRMERQAQKAAKIASALAAHPHVTKIYFPGNYSSETNTAQREEKTELYRRQCTGTGSMISIVVHPNTRRAAYRVLNAVAIAHLAVGLGSTETLIEHPRSMTHSNMQIKDLDASGIVEGMIRISVGLESTKDLIRDLLSALDRLQEKTLYEEQLLLDDCESVYSA